MTLGQSQNGASSLLVRPESIIDTSARFMVKTLVNIECEARCVVGESNLMLLQGSGFMVQGSGFRVQGSGFRVQGCGRRQQPASAPRVPRPQGEQSNQ